MHRLGREFAGPAAGGAEEGPLTVVADAGGGEIFVDKGVELVVRRHFVALAAFFVQPYPPALAVRVVVVDAHRDDGADAGEGVGHDADQRAVAQTDDGRGVEPLQAIFINAAIIIRPAITAARRRSQRRHPLSGPE